MACFDALHHLYDYKLNFKVHSSVYQAMDMSRQWDGGLENDFVILLHKTENVRNFKNTLLGR
jgi:hypothetical protein